MSYNKTHYICTWS